MKTTPILLLLLVLLLTMVTPTISATAQETASTVWQAAPVTPACWFIPTNWSAGPPDANLAARIDNGGVAVLHGSDAEATAASLTLGGTMGGSLDQLGGSLQVAGDTWLGPAVLYDATAAIWPPQYGVGGSYHLSDGAFSTGGAYIGSGCPYVYYGSTPAATGSTLRQTGGRSEYRQVLHVGFSPYRYGAPIDNAPIPPTVELDPSIPFMPGATYDLRGGEMSATRVYVGYEGSGHMIQTGDAIADIDALFVGGGPHDIYPTAVQVPDATDPTVVYPWYTSGVGSAGSASLPAIHTAASDSVILYPWYNGAAYTISSGRLAAGSIHVGQEGYGTFNQIGGGVTVESTLQIGGNWWWYLIDGMSPDPPQTMFTDSMPELYQPQHGAYTLSSGLVQTAATEIGVGGTGIFVQHGGAHEVAGLLRLGGSTYSPVMLVDVPAFATTDGASPSTDAGFAPLPYPAPSSGSYLLTDGFLSAGEMELGSGYNGWPTGAVVTPGVNRNFWAPIPIEQARFIQTGGAVHIDGDLHVRGGQYSLEGGALSAYALDLSGDGPYTTGTFVQTGGAASFLAGVRMRPSAVPLSATPYQRRSYRIEGGALTTEQISMTGGGSSAFTQTGGDVNVQFQVYAAGDDTLLAIRDGRFVAPVVRIGQSVSSTGADAANGNRFELGRAARVTITDRLILEGDAQFASDGGTLHMSGADFLNRSTRSANLSGLDSTTLVFSIGPEDDLFWERLEVAGEDLGHTRAGFWDNFVLDTLILGGADVAELLLIDEFNNQIGCDQPEALYVRHLVVGAGSRLDLNGLNLYYLRADIDPAAEILGGLTERAAPSHWATPGDSNLDGAVDLDDFVCLKHNFGHMGDAHWGMGDYNDDGCVDLDDFATLKNHFGRSSDVPEPMTLALLAIGAAAVRPRRRR